MDGPALSVVLRNHRREATQHPEIRRKSARDQGLERSDAWVRGSAAGGVPVLRSSGAAAWQSAGDCGSWAGGASGARPGGPGRAPEQGLVMLRRYRCRACEAVVVVGPRGLLRRRWYSAGAVGLSLLGYGDGESSTSVRARTSPSRTVGGSAVEHWVTLRRWVEAARDGELFGVSGLTALARRSVARQVAQVLAARGGRELGGLR